MEKSNTGDRLRVISHMELRTTLGIIGFSFPIILMLGGFLLQWEWTVQPSVSDYYGTPMRNVFVGFLMAIGLFLFTYKYDKEDNIAGNLGGVFAVLVALFPTTSSLAVIRGVHLASAASLFAVLTYFSFCLFTKTDPDKEMSDRKKLRNKIYKTCGWVMAGSILILILYFIVKWLTGMDLENICFVYIFESIALIAFGFSWLVKGEFFFGDEKKK